MGTSGDVTGINKLDKSDIPNVVYINDGSGDPSYSVVWSIVAAAFSIPLRSATGQFEAGDPVNNLDVVNKQWLMGQLLQIYASLMRDPIQIWDGIITRDANGAPISAPVKWPDQTTGTFTGVPSAIWPGQLDEWSATYGAFTITQIAGYDANGNLNYLPYPTIV